MQAKLRRAMQAAIWGLSGEFLESRKQELGKDCTEWSASIGERVTVHPVPPKRGGVREGRRPVTGRAVFAPSGEVVQGADGALVVSGDVQFLFRSEDTAMVAALVRGAVVERLDTGERFRIDATDGVAARGVHAVTVIRVESGDPDPTLPKVQQ